MYCTMEGGVLQRKYIVKKGLEPKYHVLSLKSSQQAALRYCLFNCMQQHNLSLLKVFLRKNDVDTFEKISAKMTKAIVDYDIFVSEWPIIRDHKLPSKRKLFYFSEKDFQQMVRAVRMYDKETASFVLGETKANLVDAEMEKLSDMVEYASIFTFAMKEIKLEMLKVR